MKTFLTNLKRRLNRSKYAIASLIVVGAMVGGVVYAGFGPDRPVFDWNNPADQKGSLIGPVFDSFINTPTYGDERNFSRISPVVAGQNPWDAKFSEQATATGGQEYWVRTFVHNDANQSTNCLPVHKDVNGNCTQVDPTALGVAHNTRVRLAIASGTANGVDVMSYISADNALNKDGQSTPTIWDSSTLVNDNQRFNVSYVPGSAIIVNDAHPNGAPVSDDIMGTNGTPIGFNQNDGTLPGCFQFSAYVFVKVKVSAPQLTITKQVRMAGTTAWQHSVNAKPGDTVQWLIHVTNTGTATQHQVVASDLLPPHLSFVNGSAKWYNDVENGTAYNFNQLIINNGKGGYIFGDYLPNGDFLVRFDTTVNNDFSPCSISLENVAHTKSQEQTNELSATAVVNVAKPVCQQPVTPTTPTSLPNTGPGDVLGIFTATTIAGAGAHQVIRRRAIRRTR